MQTIRFMAREYTKCMDKALSAHKRFIEEKLNASLTEKETQSLLAYHIERVRDFQHERLIHLLVTFFFAILLIAAATALLVQPLPELTWPLGFLTAILFVLELAYIRHYYLLENGVQSLYPLTEKLGTH